MTSYLPVPFTPDLYTHPPFTPDLCTPLTHHTWIVLSHICLPAYLPAYIPIPLTLLPRNICFLTLCLIPVFLYPYLISIPQPVSFTPVRSHYYPVTPLSLTPGHSQTLVLITHGSYTHLSSSHIYP